MKRVFDYSRDLLKGIAIVSMTFDHIGVILYPTELAFLMVGRLAFPIFAYLLVLGIEDTQNVKAYFLRLFFFGLISQIPYFLAFGLTPIGRLNIFFSLLLGALTIYFLNTKSPFVILPFLFSFILNSEGNIFSIAIIIGMKILQENPKLGIAIISVLNVPFLFSQDIVQNIQIASLVALPLIILHTRDRLKLEIEISKNSTLYSIRRYAFYIYYPLHLTLLYLVSLSF
ncbi:MAG: hypothetical protein JSV51_09545 [Candidatus Bathyarchaeota archaeon]|nr:MAG: hypothetical protein JSV51_09545 [Candidatus Bathyarchaeota archaeon]